MEESLIDDEALLDGVLKFGVVKKRKNYKQRGSDSEGEETEKPEVLWEDLKITLHKGCYLERGRSKIIAAANAKRKHKRRENRYLEIARSTTVKAEPAENLQYPFIIDSVETSWRLAAKSEEERDLWIAAVKDIASGALRRRLKCMMVGDVDMTLPSKFVKAASEYADVDERTQNHLELDTVYFVDCSFQAKDKRTNEELILEMIHLDSSSMDFSRIVAYLNADVIVICFDVTKRSSFEQIENLWYAEINKNDQRSLPRILMGFRDGDDEVAIDRNEAETLADWTDCELYFEVNFNSAEIFTTRSSMDSQELENNVGDILSTIIAESVDANNRTRRNVSDDDESAEESQSDNDDGESAFHSLKGAAVGFTTGVQTAVKKNVEKLRKTSKRIMKHMQREPTEVNRDGNRQPKKLTKKRSAALLIKAQGILPVLRSEDRKDKKEQQKDDKKPAQLKGKPKPKPKPEVKPMMGPTHLGAPKRKLEVKRSMSREGSIILVPKNHSVVIVDDDDEEELEYDKRRERKDSDSSSEPSTEFKTIDGSYWDSQHF